MKRELKDPDLARLFENTYPNTLGKQDNSTYRFGVTETDHFMLADTTVKYFDAEKNYAFLVTGVNLCISNVLHTAERTLALAGYQVRSNQCHPPCAYLTLC